MEQESNLNCTIENFEEQENFSDKEIFTKIWTSPRKVFKYIVNSNYRKYSATLLVLAGISNIFFQSINKNLGNNFSLLGIILFCIIAGGLLGWMSFYFYAALLSWTGKWLKGEGNTDSFVRIISYAMIPSIVAMLLLIPQIYILGADLFTANHNFEGASVLSRMISGIVLMITGVLQMILGIWTMVLCVIGISEVQEFSIGKSILNMLIPGLLLFAIVLSIILLIR